MRVVVLAPVDNSPFARSVIGLCHAEPNVELAGIILRKILNPARLRSELRRDGARLVSRVWKKLVLGSEDGIADDQPGFNDVAVEAGIGNVRVSGFAKRNGVPCVSVTDFNDARSIAALQQMRPDVVAFTGGGIIRQPLLDTSGAGIFNTHMGILPWYRGMDVVEWPIIEGKEEEIGLGVTLHFMDRGIDTGPIAMKRRVPICPGDTVERLRKRFEIVMVDLMLEGIRAVRDGTLELQAQQESDGRQYYLMHPRFYQEVRKRLCRLAGETPSAGATPPARG